MATTHLNYIHLVDEFGNYTLTKGEQGLTGEKGATGSAGGKGEKGADGTDGVQGIKGDTGIAGLSVKGAKGQKGVPQGALNFKGVEANIADLPASGNVAGDVRYVLAASHFYAYNGTAWESLNTGAAVVKGQSGTDGAKGQKGQKGTQATKGQKGQQGSTGSAGTNGDKGETGQKGQQGVPGATAAAGDKGQKGTAGTNGTNGSDGNKGQKGQLGASGPTGATGATGAKGEKGEVGPTGNKGEQGASITGDKGAQGEKGDAAQQKGDAGDKGQKGDTGDAGVDGTDGEKGATGAKGDIGPSGGEKGTKGQKGQAASVQGTFSGDIIPDGATISEAFQALETEIETRETQQTAIQSALGINSGTSHFGTFTGAVLTDNGNLKGLLQSLETAVEGRSTLQGGNIFQGEQTLRDKLHIDPGDGGMRLQMNRNVSSTQFDILLGNVPSGARLNLNTVNANQDDALVVYSSKFWCRALGGASGDAEFDGDVQVDGGLTVGSTNVGTTLTALQADIDQNEADADAAIALRALAADGVFTGTTKHERIEVDNDGGYYLRLDRSTTTQIDLLTGNIPSGGNLNIKNSNANNAKVVVYSDLFWCRNLGGSSGNGKARFDGDVTMKMSSSVTPSDNNDLMIEATNDTTLTFKYKGSDGTVRSGTITLS